MRIVAIIQARMSSTRLPGKVLEAIAGKPMLARVVERVRLCQSLDAVGVATSIDPSDDAIERFCRAGGIPCHRGSLVDVLDRYHAAARAWGAEVVVRVTSDCPLIDAAILDRIVEACVREPGLVDHASNVLPVRTYPRGLDAEAFPFAVLDWLWKNDDNPRWREHVTEYIFQHPERFSVRCVRHDCDLSRHRWTVDTPEDLELVRRIYSVLGDEPFSWTRVVQMLNEHPDWQALNCDVRQKSV